MSDLLTPKSAATERKSGLDSERIFELENWPFYWLTHTFGRYQAALEQMLKSLDLDVPRWRVLLLLGGGDAQSVTYLAKEAITKLSTMTRIVQRMERDGLVKTRASAADARVTEVYLTARGGRARTKAWDAADEMYARAFNGISDEKIRRMNRLLKDVYDNLDAE